LRLLATAAPWVRIQTSLKNTKWAAKEWPTHSNPPKEINQKKYRKKVLTQRSDLLILHAGKRKMKGFTIKTRKDEKKIVWQGMSRLQRS
jgi:hypothetical protein